MKTIALVDGLDKGHHVGFIRQFAKSLLDLGYKILILFPESNQVIPWLNIHCPQHSSHIFYKPYNFQNKKFEKFGRFNDALSALTEWFFLKKTIRKFEKEEKVKIHHVFLAWLDTFLACYLHPRIVAYFFGWEWSGLYFHPKHMRLTPQCLKDRPSLSDIDILLTSVRCKGIAVHDEGIINIFSKRLNKLVVLFPEFADDTIPTSSHALAQSIIKRAKGRTIVGMIGLELRKGLYTMVQLAKALKDDDFFFVFCGNKNYDSSHGEGVEIENFLGEEHENCFVHFSFIKEGHDYNSIFNTFDIPFIVYINFASSSNVLTKAAIFCKLVIASNRFCIGEDVKKYKLGLTIEEGNIDQAIDALKKLRIKIEKNDLPVESFILYKDLHNIKMLPNKFATILNN